MTEEGVFDMVLAGMLADLAAAGLIRGPITTYD
jgi:hypothetical protein